MRRSSDCLSGYKLLIVDGDDLVLESTATILSSWGYGVSTATSLKDVQKRLAGGGVWDLIISDYQLDDGATGLDVIEAVRHKLGKPIPCVLISGDTRSEVFKLANGAGHFLLHKPVKPGRLKSLVQYLLDEDVQPEQPSPLLL